MKQSWIPFLLLLLVSASVAAQVFYHDAERVRWEAEVTVDSFALREHRKGAAGGSSEFVCPLGPAIRATAVTTGSDAGRVCLVFSKDKCAYKSGESAPGNPVAQPGGATFKCVDFATAEQASALATLINAGTHPRRDASAVRSAAGSKGAAEAARPTRASLSASAPQKGPPAPPRTASGPPAFASGEADPAIAKLLARAQERAAAQSSSDAPASAIPMPNGTPSPNAPVSVVATPNAKPPLQEAKPQASSVSRLEEGRVR